MFGAVAGLAMFGGVAIDAHLIAARKAREAESAEALEWMRARASQRALERSQETERSARLQRDRIRDGVCNAPNDETRLDRGQKPAEQERVRARLCDKLSIPRTIPAAPGNSRPLGPGDLPTEMHRDPMVDPGSDRPQCGMPEWGWQCR